MAQLGQIVFQDDFTAANSTAPLSLKWTNGFNGCTNDIQSNQLRLALSASAGGYSEFGTVISTWPVTVPAFEIACDMQVSVTTEFYPSVNLGGGTAATDTPQQNGYAFILSPSGSTVEIARYDGNTKVPIVSDTGFTFAANTTIHLRWRLNAAGLHQAKVWIDPNGEPAATKWTFTDATWALPANRRVGLCTLTGSAAAARNFNVDFIVVREVLEGVG